MKRTLPSLVLAALLTLLAWSAVAVSDLMRERPVAVQLGFTPPASVMKAAAGEHRYSVAQLVVLKVLFYFGSLVEEWKNQVELPPEYQNMYRTLEAAVQLDPYNADAYYFTQAIFTWDAGQFENVNRLLEYGMEYRDWDPMLPFFAGFNAGYFLKDFDKASEHMARAAEISGNPAIARLASRYYYEAGEVDLAIQFLRQMEQMTPSRRESELYRLRREALEAVRVIQGAVEEYRQQHGRMPENLDTLLRVELLTEIPPDPYGGQFYLDDAGQVRSTSNLARPRTTER